jgi:hypothetical protein
MLSKVFGFLHDGLLYLTHVSVSSISTRFIATGGQCWISKDTVFERKQRNELSLKTFTFQRGEVSNDSK